MSDTDSSSEEENIKRLVEATDTQFLSNSLYKKETDEVKSETTLPSLRNNNVEDEDYNFLKVTPGFRDFVAKHLDKRLEELVKYTDKSGQNDKSVTNDKEPRTGSVKLFRNFEGFLETEDHGLENDDGTRRKIKKPKFKRKIKDDIQEDEETRIKSVAVSPEYVLNQTGTEHWKYKTKVLNYKKTKKGTLVSVD